MAEWICKYCDKDTKYIDVDYLVGYDHLQCILEAMDDFKKLKAMKIKNWDKINGYTYKGYSIVNPAYGVGSKNVYYADVLDLNLPHKPKWTLELNLDKTRLMLTDTNGLVIKHDIELVDIRTAGLFRVRFEEILDEMLKVQLISATTPKSHSYQSAVTAATQRINSGGNGTIGSGILNAINANGTNIVVSGNNGGAITQYNLIDTIKELQQQIDELNTRFNTPVNPF